MKRGRSEVTEGSVPVVGRWVARRARGGADAGARESGKRGGFHEASRKMFATLGPANQRPTKHGSRASRGSGVTDHSSRVCRKNRTCLIGSVRVHVEKGDGEDQSVVFARDFIFRVSEFVNFGPVFWYRQSAERAEVDAATCACGTAPGTQDARMITRAWRGLSHTARIVSPSSRGSVVSKAVRLSPRSRCVARRTPNAD